MAQDIDTVFTTKIPERAYEVRLADNGSLYWLEKSYEGGTVRHAKEPGATFLQK